MLADTLEAAGIPRGDYLVRVNNRKVLTGLLERLELQESAAPVLRALDKLAKSIIGSMDQLVNVASVKNSLAVMARQTGQAILASLELFRETQRQPALQTLVPDPDVEVLVIAPA